MSKLGTIEVPMDLTGPTDPAKAPAAPPAVPAADAPKTPDGLTLKTADRPAWLPEKFKTPEDFRKSYDELETKQATGVKPDVKPDGKSDAKGPLTDVEFAALDAEFIANGGLAPDSYKMLEARGYPRALVDAYVDGRQARAEQVMSRVWNEIGGQDKYAGLQAWAVKSMSPEALAVYNADVKSGDANRVLAAVQNLKARFVAAGGVVADTVPSGERVGGGPPTGGGGFGFQSREQVVAAMRTEQYKNDPAYREYVKQALANSDIFKASG